VERERPIRVELPRCPFCHENVKADGPKHGCADCMAWHHEGCWRESGAKCAACGRGEAATTVRAPEASRPMADAWLSTDRMLFYAIVTVGVIALGNQVPGDRGIFGVIVAFMLLALFVGGRRRRARRERSMKD
jgi:hypothetical protein